MICKKCGIEIGRQDRCPECGCVNGYSMDEVPDDLKEIDELLPAAAIAQRRRRQSDEKAARSVPSSQRIRQVSPDGTTQPGPPIPGKRPASLEYPGKAAQPVSPIPRTRQTSSEYPDGRRRTAAKGSNAERYLGKVPQPEFKHGSPKKKNKRQGLMYVVLGIAAFLVIGFLAGLLTGRMLWYHPQTEVPEQTESGQTEPIQTEPRQTEPMQTEPLQTESDVFGADTFESDSFEPGRPENDRGDVNISEPEGNRGGSPTPSYSDGRWH